jgi:hypothetical protein
MWYMNINAACPSLDRDRVQTVLEQLDRLAFSFACSCLFVCSLKSFPIVTSVLVPGVHIHTLQQSHLHSSLR